MTVDFLLQREKQNRTSKALFSVRRPKPKARIKVEMTIPYYLHSTTFLDTYPKKTRKEKILNLFILLNNIYIVKIVSYKKIRKISFMHPTAFH